ncbi:MAG: cobalamin biosynthesis protein CbiX [Methylophaga sp.]|uniref:sirohydrochlorin chelatase n=1 Tax=Methylophaga sp. UBA678 TaxID=1946901 RepID=UPI000C37D136|nr:CbiX/SirB N-terminal domain-containing protein [Methylophaga sp. UBA678]MAX50520.1 cobalamin biosynthesis protein CbiX [Methylophaga sp.]|tara:strand:- start:4403 stop:4768 length:366 start_codon:yes stop_codon:yes gene_type:complete
MKALLIIAHGSRRQASNDEVKKIATQIREHGQHDFDMVESAFLELAYPLIPEGIEHCVKSGAKQIVVSPYFLNSGKHVTEDIPEIIADVKAAHPDIIIEVTPHVGSSPIMLDLILQTASGS